MDYISVNPLHLVSFHSSHIHSAAARQDPLHRRPSLPPPPPSKIPYAAAHLEPTHRHPLTA